MKSFFEETTYNEVLQRVRSLHQGSERKWGKMTVGQMVWHCQYPLEIAIENKKGGKKGNPLIRWFFKKSLYNDTLWRKNLPTTPKAKAMEEKDFITERKKLEQLLHDLYALRERTEWNPHPLFGSFTHEQWGQLEYKHLDHHLRQFGV
ncbi:DUF1569 domain-containing protein [Flavobacteriaceae bacterium 3-367]|uniref:DUF1569 domain-containing protein n=1 Tax=Eudoraea algarum TaxID=3417568 RepID=UPI00328E4103